MYGLKRKENIMIPIVYTVSEVAELLCISRSHAYRLVNQGLLPVLDLGTRKVIPKEYLDKWLKENKKKWDDKSRCLCSGYVLSDCKEISEECVKKWLRFDRWIKKKNEPYDTGSRGVLPVSHKV